MDKIKTIIIIVVIVIILLFIALVFINGIDKKEKEKNFENTFEMEVLNTINYVKNRNEFFAVKSCVTKYLSYLTQKDNEMVYSFLDKNYIEKYNIKKETAIKDEKDYENPIYLVNKMYVLQDTAEVYTYFVYGKIVDKQTTKIEDYNIVIRLDKEKDLFSVIPYEFIEDNNYNIEIGNTIRLKYNELPSNTYNKFAFKNITDSDMVAFYTNEIKDMAIYNEELLYNKLEKTYLQNKFTDFEKYKNYITKNITSIYQLKIKQYKINDYETYKQYICIDENEKYYIINEINVGQYEVILDTYTIDLPEYIEKYNKSQDEQKVAFCIDKFMKNVNDENYTLAYSMLSNGFKNNYFKTQNEFENYAKQYLLGKSITFEEIKNEADIYIYKVKLTKNGQPAQSKNFNVKLGSRTNFELSFNVN